MNNIVILEQTLLPDAWKTLLLKGIVLLVLGIFCLAFPFAALNVGAYVIAILLLFVSIAFCLYPLLHFSQDLLRLVNQKQRGGWYCLVS